MSDDDLPKAPDQYTPHHHTLDSGPLEKLHDSPRPRKEFEGGFHVSSSGLRQMVDVIKSPVFSSSGNGTHYGRWTEIAYLYGDERRAIRVAIEENEEFIADALRAESADVFNQKWDRGMYRILCEEWAYYRRNVVTDDE